MKLYAAFAVVFVALLTIGVLAMVNQSNLSAIATDLGTVQSDKVKLAERIDTETSNYRAAEAQHILSIDPANMAAATKELTRSGAAVDTMYREYTAYDNDATVRQSLTTFNEAWNAYRYRVKRTIELSSQNLNDQATASFRGEQAAYDAQGTAIGKVKALQQQVLRDAVTAASSTASHGRMMTIGGIVMVAIAIFCIVLVLIRGIAKPLSAMTSAMGQLAAGNVRVEVPVSDSRDEVGDLAKAMVQFRNQLAAAEQAKAQQTEMLVSSIGEGLEQLAKGNLVVRVEADLTGPFAKLKNDFNNAVGSLQSTLSLVSQSTDGIHSGAGDISQASDDLSHRTEQQAASLEETAAAMDEITNTVKLTAVHAGKANAAVGETRSEAERSETVVRETEGAMNRIERSSQEISEIIAVIDGIAFQTNLLALNAGVEAARAGDAGKGFAVVASEVRALAQRSAEAAKDVKIKITTSSEQVDTGVRLVSETGQSLKRIVTRISEISELVGQIAMSAEQQATGLQQVNTAVAEMDGVTQQNAAMVEEATAAARSLASEADELSRQVGRFQLGGSPRIVAVPTRSEGAARPQAKPRGSTAPRLATRGNAALAAETSTDDWSSF